MELFEYDPRSDAGLRDLQNRVGGYLEIAPITDSSLTLYCNEEGKLQGLVRNDIASNMLAPTNPDWIAGDAVLVGAPDSEGYDTSLPDVFKEVLNEQREDHQA